PKKQHTPPPADPPFGSAPKLKPKYVSPSDPAAQWTGAMRGPPFFAYSNNYLTDVKVGIIMDVEASRAIRQAEVGASKTMIERTQERFDIKPERLAGDTAYGSGANLNWLVKDKDIAPHIPVIDKSKREDGTFSREDFTFDKDRNVYICPANKILTTTGKVVNDGETLLYRAKARDCRGCLLKAQCCPKASVRKIPRVATDGFNKWHQSSRAVRMPTFTTKSAPNGHGPMSDLSPLSGEVRKSNFGAAKSVDDPSRTRGRSVWGRLAALSHSPL